MADSPETTAKPLILTNADFAVMAARIAQTASGLAADCLVPGQWRDDPITAEALGRFLREMRRKLDWLEERANGKHF